MTKYSGYSRASASWRENSGAFLVGSYSTDEYNHSSAWKKLTYEFDTGNSTTYTLTLQNGISDSKCKGTAWFSDFKFEEAENVSSNRWNVLAVIFKKVEAPVYFEGKHFTYKASLNNNEVKKIEKTLNRLYTSVPLLSDGLWGFNDIDVVSTDSVVDNLFRYSDYDGCRLEPTDKCVSNVLDKYIEKAKNEYAKTYNQIICIAPLRGVAGGWLGLGGTKYKNINFCQVEAITGEERYKDGQIFPESIFVHEMLHCVERISKSELYSSTQRLHACYDTYSKYYQYSLQDGWDEWGKYYSDYMRCKTPDKKGVDKRAFTINRLNGYKVVYSSSLTAGITDVSKLTVSKPKDKYYTGKAIQQVLTVKNGSKTLTEGKDYTLSYVNNTKVGYAAVIVNGKGNYTGKYVQNFKILPRQSKLTAVKSGNEYSFSWQTKPEAEGYEIYYSTNNGKSYSLLKTVYGNESAISVTIKSSATLKFKMRTVTTLYPQKFTSAYSSVVTAKKNTSNTNPFESGKLYSIRCKKDESSLNIYKSGKNEGDNLILFKYSSYSNQQWYLEKQSNGNYVIRNLCSNLVLGVENSSAKDGANIAQYSYNGSKSQQWKIENINGYYKIINCNSGKALEVEGAKYFNGANISQNTYTGKDNQLWVIEAVE